jgi:hypothetical protein
MGYHGGKLAPWFNTAPNAVASRAMAEKGGERMTERTRMNTPIHFGELRASIKQKMTVVYPSARGMVYESGVETNVSYAPYVEQGTGIHGPMHRPFIITPKRPDGWLRWINPVTGKPVFAKRVVHPGSPGQHMFSIGASMSEHEFYEFAQPILTRWKYEVEQQNHSTLRGV